MKRRTTPLEPEKKTFPVADLWSGSVALPKSVPEAVWPLDPAQRIRSASHLSLGEAKQRKLYTSEKQNRHTGDAPSNQPIVAGVFLQRNSGTLK